MILHKREEKLSCGSSDEALNNNQKGLPRLPMVGLKSQNSTMRNSEGVSSPFVRGGILPPSFFLAAMSEALPPKRKELRSLLEEKQTFGGQGVESWVFDTKITSPPMSRAQTMSSGHNPGGGYRKAFASRRHKVILSFFVISLRRQKNSKGMTKKVKPVRRVLPHKEPTENFATKRFFCPTFSSFHGRSDHFLNKEAVPYTDGIRIRKKALSVKNNQVGAVFKRKTKRRTTSFSLTKTKKPETGKDLLLGTSRNSYNVTQRGSSSDAIKGGTLPPKGVELFCKKQPPFYPPLPMSRAHTMSSAHSSIWRGLASFGQQPLYLSRSIPFLLSEGSKDGSRGSESSITFFPSVARRGSDRKKVGKRGAVFLRSLRIKAEQFFLQKSNPSKTQEKELFSEEEPFKLRSFVGIRSSFASYQNSYDFRIAFKNRLIPREYSLETFHRSNQDTCLLHNPAVFEGDWVQSGDLLADCAASSGGELSLGKNILIAYMPWEGYNFEDAILISERLVFEDVYSSIHIERYDIEIRETKYGMETITRNIPELNEKELEHLDSNGVAKLGSWIQEGDVLVGRVTPINKKVQSTYKNLLFTILQTKPESVRDSSLRAPRGMKGKIVNVQRFAHHGSEELEGEGIPLRKKNEAQKGSPTSSDSGSSYDSILPAGRSTLSIESPEELGSVKRPGLEGAQINIVYVYLAEKRKIQVGDKMAGRHGNKGIVSQVLPRQDMPFLANGTPIDMVLNPLGVPSRMNVGQIYECLLGLAAKYLGEHYKIFPFDEKYGPEASRSFVYSKLYEARKKTGSEWLFNPNCPGKTRLFDGRTGDPFDQSVTVGYAYMLKLVHLVDDKIHMRSTGPYSLVTQQPLRGRSKQGGQRLGEMEVWALEGYGAAFTLLEMLTIKSDDMTGRMTLWSNLILNKDLSIGTPESFKVLVCELQALCLDIGIFRVDSVGNLAEIESLTELP